MKLGAAGCADVGADVGVGMGLGTAVGADVGLGVAVGDDGDDNDATEALFSPASFTLMTLSSATVMLFPDSLTISGLLFAQPLCLGVHGGLPLAQLLSIPFTCTFACGGSSVLWRPRVASRRGNRRGRDR